MARRRRYQLWCLLAVAGCSHQIESPQPSAVALAPDLVCNAKPADGATITLTGANFTPMPSNTLAEPPRLRLPTIKLHRASAIGDLAAPTDEISIVDDATQPRASRVQWHSETEMAFQILASDGIEAGVFDLEVTNPDGKHAATLSQALAIVPPPQLTRLAPAAICVDQADQMVVAEGANFLAFDGALPALRLQGITTDKTYAAVSVSDCVNIVGNLIEKNTRLCKQATFVVPKADIAVTNATAFSATLSNPAPADCASSAPVTLTIEPPPRVTQVSPATVCTGGAALTIQGANFLPGAQVTLQCGNVPLTATASTVAADGTSLSVQFGPGAPPETECSVIVRNTDSCIDSTPHRTVSVVSGPILFAADPAVAYANINTRVTFYATAIRQPVATNAVHITPHGAATPSTELVWNAVPNFPNRLQVIVPSGLAPGAYDLHFQDSTGCPSLLENAFDVTATATVTVKKLVPAFGYTGSDTDVTILRDTEAPLPGNHPFVQTPRVFLNPTNSASTDVAVELASVAYLDNDRLTGTVPNGTPVNDYDVIVVNPDKTVGRLVAGFKVHEAPPPVIQIAVPASIVANAGQSVVLTGTNFESDNVVSLQCVDAAGTQVAAPTITQGTTSCQATTCTKTINVNGSTLAAGNVCVARLTNPNGAFGEYSAIGVTNSSRNLNSPKTGPNLVMGRRGLSAAAGQATAASRFVYAIGGDSGTVAGAYDSVEFASVDLFGTISPFAISPNKLHAPRTLGGTATIGSYVYYVGGNSGGNASAAAERALILSPKETPVIADLDFALVATGLAPGEYRYRVSAVFAANDSDNPDGESLASDAFTVRVPAFTGRGINVSLTWRAPVDRLGAPLPNVVGYRVYRSPVGGLPGTETLIGSTTGARSFIDDGSATASMQKPVPLGSTGAWAQLPNLTSQREGLAIAWAEDPSTVGTFYIYAIGGRQNASTALRTYEYLTITTSANGQQTVGAAWSAGGANQLAAARWLHGAWVADNTVATIYPAGSKFIFAGGGQTAAGGSQTTVEAAQVLAGGALGPWNDSGVRDFGASSSGYGVAAANGSLYTFGGQNGGPSVGSKAAVLSTPPALASGAWNDEGLAMTHGRFLLGSAVQSAFIFLIGGQTDEPSLASKTTEMVIW